jgi:hypothetical protein
MMDERALPTGKRRGVIVLSSAAIACLALATLLCALSAAKIAAVKTISTAAIELRIREPAGYWHWLVFEKYDCGIEAFDRFVAELHVNEHSALNASRLSALRFVMDGKAYDADYIGGGTRTGARGEHAPVLRFSMAKRCLDALAGADVLFIRTIEASGYYLEFSVPEPERFHEAFALIR